MYVVVNSKAEPDINTNCGIESTNCGMYVHSLAQMPTYIVSEIDCHGINIAHD